jgi:hypothetical protein
VTQSEDVLVDTRGYIYVTDKQWVFGSCATPARINPPRRTSDDAIADEPRIRLYFLIARNRCFVWLSLDMVRQVFYLPVKPEKR